MKHIVIFIFSLYCCSIKAQVCNCDSLVKSSPHATLMGVFSEGRLYDQSISFSNNGYKYTGKCEQYRKYMAGTFLTQEWEIKDGFLINVKIFQVDSKDSLHRVVSEEMKWENKRFVSKTIYRNNGKKSQEAIWKNGTLFKYYDWHENGKLRDIHEKSEDLKKVLVSKRFFDNGQLEKETLTKGKVTYIIQYDNTGKKIHEKRITEGKNEAVCISWNEGKRKKSKCQVRNIFA